MTAAEIAATLGTVHRSGPWWRCRCPVHGSYGATLALRDGEHGLIVKCWAGCDPRDVFTELRRLGLIEERRPLRAAAPRKSDIFSNGRSAWCADDDMRRLTAAHRLWGAAREASGSPVARYLAGRHITIPPPTSLRWAPALRRQDGAYAPAMIALVEHIERGFVGVHRTWLAYDAGGIWRRRDRASLGPIGGGAVRLAPAGELLMIAEGIETALSAMQATPLPAWAALSTSGVVSLVLPQIVRTILILADHDANGAGERAARSAAARWVMEGRRVRIAMPPHPGTDFNDVLLGRTNPRSLDARDAAA
jgi:putative DNA primase/helicase